MGEASITASVLYGVKDLRLESRTLDNPGPDELQISISRTGICGSDIHYYSNFRNGHITIKEPMSLGHESSGVVQAVGSASTTQQNGVIDEGALLEPLSVAIHAVRRANLPNGSSVMVIGAGTVGLLTAAVLRVNDRNKILLADINENRVQFGTSNGFADEGLVVTRRRGGSEEENLAIAQEVATAALDGKPQFDAVFECTGAESSLQTAIFATRSGGKVMLVGMGAPMQNIPVSAAASREVDLLGVFRYSNTYPYGLSILAEMGSKKGQRQFPDISKLITHRVKGLKEVQNAFELAGKEVDNDGKPIIKVVIQLDP